MYENTYICNSTILPGFSDSGLKLTKFLANIKVIHTEIPYFQGIPYFGY